MADLGLLYCAFVWGSTFIVVKQALVGVHPISLVAHRFLISALLLVPWVGPRLRTGATLREGAILSIPLALLYWTQTAGLRWTSASNSGFITGLFVVFVPVLLWLFRGQPPSRAQGAAVLLAAAGLWLLSGGPGRFNRGDALTLVSAICYAAHLLLTDRFVRRDSDPILLAFHQFWITAALSLLLSALMDYPLAVAPSSAAAVAFLAAIPTLSAFYIQMIAQRHADPTRTALIFTLEPVFAALFALGWGGESLALSAAAGGALILAAMVTAEIGARHPLSTLSQLSSWTKSIKCRKWMPGTGMVALAFLCLPAGRAAELVLAPQPGDPMQASVHRLENGLTVYLSPFHQQPRVFAAIAVRAGAKHDPEDSTGMAHYLEHMLFKGSRRMGTLDYEKESAHLRRIEELYEKLFTARDPEERRAIYRSIDEENIRASEYAVPNEVDKVYHALGFSGVNAYTTDEGTVYVCNFPANRAEAWAMVESDRFRHPVFRLFQSEIEAVYEEKNRSLDNAEVVLHDTVEKMLHKGHPYGERTVLGSIEHLKNPSLAKMLAYYDAHYRPSNMAIILAGDFERGPMLELIEKYFGAWQSRPAPPQPSWSPDRPKGEERAEIHFEAEERVVIAWPAVANSDPDRDALSVMDMIVDNAEAGLINLKLNQAQRVKAAGSYPVFYNDAGSWRVWATPKKGQSVEEAERLLLEVVESLKRGEFSEQDVRAVITDFEVNEKKRLESNAARGGALVESFVDLEPWTRAAFRLERIRKVTREDVLRVARRILGPGRVTVYRCDGKPVLPSIEKPKFTQLKIDPSRQSEFAKAVLALPTKPLEPRFIKEGVDYRVVDEPWGRLYAAPNSVNDLFSLSFVFDRGRRKERTLCEAVSLLDLSGGGGLSAEEYKKALYALGTTVSFSCSEDQVIVAVSGLEENFERSMELLRSRFQSPKTSSDTLKKMVEIAIGAHRDRKKDPGHIEYALAEYARRGSESVVLGELRDDELGRLEEAPLQGLTRSLFGFKRRALYAGTRRMERLLPWLDWGGPYRPLPAPEPKRYRRRDKPAVYFVHRDMLQSKVGFFIPDEKYREENNAHYRFFNTVMGGMSGVIFQEVREARSLAYSSSGGYSPGGRKGDENALWGSLGCQADKTMEAAELLMRLMRAPPVSEERFREAKKAIEEQYRSDVLTFRSIPGALLSWEEKGLRGDPRPKRFKRVLRYRLEDLEGFMRRFKERSGTLHVLGNRQRVDLGALGRLGAFEELKLEDIFPY